MAKGLDVLLRVIGDASSGVDAMDDSTASVSKFSLGVVAAGAALAALTLKVGADALDAFGSFEAKMRNVQSVTGDSTEALGSMMEEVKSLANRDLIAPVDDYASALYDIRSAGISSKNSMAALDTVMKTTAATQGDASDIAKILTGSINAYGEEVLTATRVGDLFAKTIAEGVTNSKEMGSYFGQLPALGAAAGVSMEELTGSIAHLTKNFIKTPDAVTAVKSAINGFIKPTEALNALTIKLNLGTADQALKSKGLAGMMKILNKETGGSVAAMGKLFSSSQALSGITVLTKNNVKDFSDQVDSMADSAGAMDKALAANTASFESTQASMKQAANILMVDLGEKAATAITPLIKAVTSLLQGWNALDANMRDSMISGALKFIATGVISSGVIGITIAVKAMTAAVIASEATFATLAVTIAPIAATILAIGAAVWVAVEAFEWWQDLQNEKASWAMTNKIYDDAKKKVKDLGKVAIKTKAQIIELKKGLVVASLSVEKGSKEWKEYQSKLTLVNNDLKGYTRKEEEATAALKDKNKELTETNKLTKEQLAIIKAKKEAEELTKKTTTNFNKDFKQNISDAKAYATEYNAITQKTIDDKMQAGADELLNDLDQLDDRIAAEENAEIAIAKKANTIRGNVAKLREKEAADKLKADEKAAEDKVIADDKALKAVKDKNQAAMALINMISNKVEQEEDKVLSGLGKIGSEMSNVMSSAMAGNFLPAIAYGFDQVTNSLKRGVDGFTMLNKAMEDGVLSAEEEYDIGQNNLKAMPVWGGVVAGLTEKWNDYTSAKEGKKSFAQIKKDREKELKDIKTEIEKQFDIIEDGFKAAAKAKIDAEKEALKDSENNIKEYYDNTKDLAKDAYSEIKDAAKDLYKDQADLAKAAIKDQEKIVDTLSKKLDDLRAKIAGREAGTAAGQKAAKLFQSDVKAMGAFADSGLEEEAFASKSAAEEVALNMAFAKGEVTYDEMQKKKMAAAVKKAVYYDWLASTVLHDNKQLAIYQGKSLTAFNKYKSASAELSTEELTAQEIKTSKQLEAEETLLKQKQTDLEVIEDDYNLMIDRLSDEFKKPANAFLEAMRLAITEANGFISSSSSALKTELNGIFNRAKSQYSEVKNMLKLDDFNINKAIGKSSNQPWHGLGGGSAWDGIESGIKVGGYNSATKSNTVNIFNPIVKEDFQVTAVTDSIYNSLQRLY